MSVAHSIKYSTLDFKNIRTYFIKSKINKNQKKSIYKGDNKTKIRIHILDSAVKLACANYKSAFTNLRNGNIRKFRIRYWKYKKPKHMMDIEPSFISHNTICNSTFGKIDRMPIGISLLMKLGSLTLAGLISYNQANGVS
jgi:hypothetical protein